MTTFRYGDLVEIPWGLHRVRGRVYAHRLTPGLERVVVSLEPELSDSVVDEPTTVSLPADAVTVIEPV
jgi:hypothetical protein